jgi:hypothetical protein
MGLHKVYNEPYWQARNKGTVVKECINQATAANKKQNGNASEH